MSEMLARINEQLLTRRQLQILALTAEGYSNKLIAAELRITQRTVKNHMSEIMLQLRAHNRTHAVVTALRRGWLRL